MIYTLTLNPAIDYVVQLAAPLADGGINRSRKEDYQFGGKGINVSNVLRTLGQPTTALGFVAGFTGQALEQGLRDMGLTTDFVALPTGQTRINVKVKADKETEINGCGPEITPADMEKLFEKLDALKAGDTLVLSGSVPGCLGSDTYGRILQAVAGKQIRTVVDAASRLLTEALPQHPFLIKPNRQELEQIFGSAMEDERQILSAARQLQQMGAENVLVSLAGEGALLLEKSGKVHRTACPKGTVCNSVGAGDSMVAGFLAGFLETGDFGYALKLGIAAGSATAFSLGLATKEEIEDLLERM